MSEKDVVTPLSTDSAVLGRVEALAGEVRVLSTEVQKLAGESTRLEVINTLLSDRVELARPIAVLLSFEQDEWIARWTEAVLEGAGETEAIALDSLRGAIVEAYVDMKEAAKEKTPLAGYAERLWNVLSRVAAER